MPIWMALEITSAFMDVVESGALKRISMDWFRSQLSRRLAET